MTDYDYLKRMYEENKSKGYIELTRNQIVMYKDMKDGLGQEIITKELIEDWQPEGKCATNLMLFDIHIKQIATLLECQEYNNKNVENGVTCPCCDRYMKLYKRSYSSGMAVFMLGLYRLTKKISFMGTEEYFHYVDVLKHLGINSGGDYAKNVFWGLIEPKADDKEELEDLGTKSSGMFKITDIGIDFVLSKIKIPKKVHLLLNEVEGFDQEKIGIEDALGNKFDYFDLMKG